MTILDNIANYAAQRVREAEKNISLAEIKERALSLPKGDFVFENALRKQEISFICEVKKASPSKGIISENFDYLNIAKEYEVAGADCISVLTEPKWFLGSDEHLQKIASEVNVPCLRKDFTVSEYMIYEARILGASAVLLICSFLTKEQIGEYIRICDTLGISSLVEAHTEDEIKTAINTGARIIGVNNRNLKDFSVDIENSKRLRELVPNDVIYVSESGIKSPDDVKILSDYSIDAVLVGETLMRAEDKTAKLRELRGY